MKKIFILSIALTALSGCNWITGGGENFPPTPEIEHYTYWSNNSSYSIEIIRYYEGEVFKPFILSESEGRNWYNNIFKEDLPYFPTIADSIKIIYDNGIHVWHTNEIVQEVSRSVLLEEFYTGGKVNDKLYEIYYKFTDADYEEAMVLNGGG